MAAANFSRPLASRARAWNWQLNELETVPARSSSGQLDDTAADKPSWFKNDLRELPFERS
jgi:hypothetical protein